MNDAIAFTQASQAGCQGGTGASSPEDGGSLPALYMKYYRAIS
ncbi:MAG TPA: hypothetical protein VFG05_00665 [Methylocella sp.]|nr:hypothetical protein [Methylocella sp.]